MALKPRDPQNIISQTSDSRDIVPDDQETFRVGDDTDLTALNLCGNAMEFALAARGAYSVDVTLAAHSRDMVLKYGDADDFGARLFDEYNAFATHEPVRHKH